MSRILSTAPMSPFIRPVNRQVQQGQGNQQQNLFALLSFLNQQQQQETSTEQRQQQIDENIRRNKREEEDREAALLRNDVVGRRFASHKKIDERVKREQNRVFREEISPAYNSSLDKINSSMRISLKGLISSRDLGDVGGIVRKLNSLISREMKKGGAHQYGALTAASQVLSQIVGILPESIKDPVLQDLELKMSERSFRSKIIPLGSSFRQLVPTLDEFRPLYNSIRDQGERAKERITDFTTQVSPTSKIDQRRIFGQIREEERFSFDRSPLSVEDIPGRTPSEAPVFSPTLNVDPETSKEGLGIEGGLRQAAVDVTKPIFEEEARLLPSGGRLIAGAGLAAGAEGVRLGKAVESFFNPKISTLMGTDISDALTGTQISDFLSGGGLNNSFHQEAQRQEQIRIAAAESHALSDVAAEADNTPPPGFFSQPSGASGTSGFLQSIKDLFGGQSPFSLQGGSLETTLQNLSVESDSRVQRGSPPLQIGQDPFPQQSGMGNTPEEFLRMLQGPQQPQDEIEKLFSLIGIP